VKPSPARRVAPLQFKIARGLETTQTQMERAASKRSWRIGFSGIPKPRPSVSPPPSGCVKSLMATMLLPPEFKSLLSALSSKKVEYLVVGGYAVIYHGYVHKVIFPANSLPLDFALGRKYRPAEHRESLRTLRM